MRHFKNISILFFLACLAIISCTEDTSNASNTDNFDRKAMLSNWADNIIVPAYQDFQSDVANLKLASDNFEHTPNQTNLDALQLAWETAYITWQNVEMFNVGPANTNFFRSFVNTYPTNATNVEAHIASGTYNLSDINSNDEQGFPALDYLLFGLATSDAETLAFYTTNSNASNYLKYLTDVVDRIKSLTDIVVSEWETGYRDTFVNNSGSTSSSSTNMLVNRLLEYYEVVFRNGKIAIPAGVFSSGTTQQSRVEAFYKKDLSKTLCLEALEAFQDFFNGKAYNGTAEGESLKSYLNFLNTMKEGADLSTIINNQFDLSRAAIEDLNDSFYTQVNTNNTKMLAVYETLQTNVIYLKSDMFSALSISIDFSSGDGD